MVDINCAFLVGGFSVIFVAMGYGYKIHVDKKTIKLEKNDKEHEKKHQHNETRIEELEKKNGAEQRQIDDLKESNKELKAELASEKKDKSELKDMVIKLQERIINCEKNGNGGKHKNR